MRAIILYSVGSPETLSVQSVKQYLDRFLSDKLVVRIPRFVWQPVLHSFILPNRPERMLRRYEAIFQDGVNPYLKSMERLSQLLEDILNPTLTASTLADSLPSVMDNINDKLKLGEQDLSAFIAENASEPKGHTNTSLHHSAKQGALDSQNTQSQTISIEDSEDPLNNNDFANDELLSSICMVRFAYAYSQPSLVHAVTDCIHAGAEEIITIPLFPQYSDTTSKRPLLTLKSLQKKYPDCTFKLVSSYSTNEFYIDTLASITRTYLDQASKLCSQPPHLLISYHSLPKSYIKLGDPYLKECQATTRALVKALGLQENQYTVGYQSKMSPMTWIKPYIEDACQDILNKNHSNLVVLTPGFSIDCLETLYELGHGIRQQFLTKGGEHFTLIPCLNESVQHVQLLKKLIAIAQPLS